MYSSEPVKGNVTNDSWRKMEDITRKAGEKMQLGTDLIHVLEKYYACEVQYLSHLEKVSLEASKLYCEGSLARGIAAFKNTILSRIDSQSTFIKGLNEQICAPLNSSMVKESLNYQASIGEIKKWERDYKMLKDKLEKTKNAYKNANRAVDDVKIEKECLTNIKYPDKEKLSNITLNINELLDCCFECKCNYQNMTDQYNSFIMLYSIELDKMNRTFGKHEVVLESNIKDTIMKFLNLANCSAKNYQLDVEKVLKSIQQVQSLPVLIDSAQENKIDAECCKPVTFEEYSSFLRKILDSQYVRSMNNKQECIYHLRSLKNDFYLL